MRQSSTLATVSVGTINLRAYPKAEGSAVTPREVLRTSIYNRSINASSENRTRFGRSLSMDRIEMALLQAFRGSMRDITDILAETVDTDPHLGSILNKRFGAVGALPFEVQPASGVGVDRAKAIYYAEVVRQQLRAMKSFRRNITQLAWGMWNGRACLELNWVELSRPLVVKTEALAPPNMAVGEMVWIHPRRLSFGPSRELRIQTSDAVGGNFSETGIDIRALPDKFIYWLPQLFNEYPEREGLGMRCMYWSFFKRFAARERMILTELYGKPWRIIEVEEQSTAGSEELDAADRIVDALGQDKTARMPRGTKLNVVSPAKSAGDVHKDIIDDSDKQNSKLVLGQTGTTDGVPSGLNNNQANVMQDEQLGVLFRDAALVSEVIEAMLTDRIIAVNFGEAEITHAPYFRLRADLPADRKAELERLKLALDAGLAVQQGEAYEVSGFSQPEGTDVVIRIEQPPTPPNSPVAPAPRAVVVYPKGLSPDVGEQQPPTPAAGPGEGEPPLGSSQVGAPDARNTITVNEDRKSRGLPALTTPDGQLDPRGNMTVAEYAAQVAPLPGEAAPEAKPDPVLDLLPLPQASKRVRLSNVAAEVAEGEELHGDGGIHAHSLDRALLATAIDGKHVHVFKLGEGDYVVSELDGAHSHELVAAADDATVQSGKHMHSVVIDDIAWITVEEGSDHRHALQVSATAVDAGHVHSLVIADRTVEGGQRTVRSMTAGEIAVDISKGLLPVDDLEEILDGIEEESGVPQWVTTSGADVARERFACVHASLGDPAETYALVQGAHTAEIEQAKWSDWLKVHEINLTLKQPTTSNGTPDDLVGKGVRELAAQTNAWADAFAKAVESETTTLGAYRALIKARQKLSVMKFGRALERRGLHALMLGALDNVKEMGSLEPANLSRDPLPDASTVKLTLSKNPDLMKIGLSQESWVTLAASKDFSGKPFKQALQQFSKLEVLDKPTFERANAAIKQRSFTAAGVVGDQMLQTLQKDLVKTIEAGEDLRLFKERMKPRLADAGFTSQLGTLKSGAKALNPAHLEVVMRTNVMNVYNSGRYVQQTQPAVLVAFPVWEIQGVNDTRTRETHLHAHGKKLLATDPFWAKAYPPLGFSCMLPDVQMQGDFVGASEAWYEGQAIELRTAKGRELRVTANHPVLTTRGLLPAQELRKGDKLVSYSRQPGIAALGLSPKGYEHHAPTEAQQVFSTMAKAYLGSAASPSPDDFHGEAKRFVGQVHVVGTYSELAREMKLLRGAEVDQFELEAPNSARTVAFATASDRAGMLKATGSAQNRFMSSSDLRAALASGHLAPFETLSFGAISHLDVQLPESISESRSTHAEFIGQLLERGAGEVSLDELIDVREFEWRGHVYDFQSETGWMLAEGLVVSNCRCRVKSLTRSSLKDVVSGGSILGLPDPGFTSGRAALSLG